MIVKFKQEQQVNQKQLAASFDTDFFIPGNYLPNIDVPTLQFYADQYKFARVKRTSVVVTFTNVEATYSKDVGITQLSNGQTTNVAGSAVIYLSEQPRTVSAYLTPLSGSRSMKTLKTTGTSSTSWGNHFVTTAQHDILSTAALTTPPSQPWGYSVWTQNSSGAGTLETAGTNMRIMTFYTVEFLNRNEFTA